MSGEDGGTIAAVATAPGRGGIGIVRISGERALAVAERIFRRKAGGTIAAARPWTLLLGSAVEPATGTPLDEALAVRMPAGRSYTGEETVEIHGHGGPAVLEAILGAALRAGARLAAPGEFTRRAFLGGRIDLAQAEAVAELIAADSPLERDGALRRLGGGAGRAVDAVRARLLDALASVEAQIEFGEEEGLEEPFPSPELRAIASEMAGMAAAARRGGLGARRPRVVILGPVNSGKSSLFNYLVDSERAIVTAVPGTTRDYIEAGAVVSGVDLVVVDTAGIRDSGCEVEQIGIRRGLAQVEGADLILHLVDGSTPLDASDRDLAGRIAGRARIVVVTKADLPSRLAPAGLDRIAGDAMRLSVSTVTGEGCPGLADAVAGLLRRHSAVSGEGPAALNPRQTEALERAAAGLEAALLEATRPGGTDRALEELRLALASIDEVTGTGVAGEVLERIFSRFCIGK